MKFYFPLFVVIISNTIYHICSKATPSKIDTFASLSFTYTVGAVISLLLYFVTNKDGHLIVEYKQVNWASAMLGIAIIGLEAGFLLMYRAGWNISIGQLVASVGVAIVLIIVGTLFYHEQLTFRKVAGVVICLVGMYLIN